MIQVLGAFVLVGHLWKYLTHLNYFGIGRLLFFLTLLVINLVLCSLFSFQFTAFFFIGKEGVSLNLKPI